MKKTIIFITTIISSIYIFGCAAGPSVYYVKPPDWRAPELQDSTINFYSQFYKGFTIFIDPGHGGEDRHNRGPKGLAIEADLNLRVGLYLRDYIKRAGGNVVMSRDFDTLIALKDRSIMANNSGADIFVSIHHNAPGKGGDIYTNFTSTYYHATPKDYEYDPCNHDIAKYIQRDLAYVMGNSGGLGSFDGTYSDYWIYPGAGFSVLRLTEIPRVLTECSFFTSEYEEQRLIIDEFNQIQAWGIFRGLGKYLRQGIVRLSNLSELKFNINKPQIALAIDDQDKGIDTTFFIAQIDKEQAELKFQITKDGKYLVVSPKSELKPGEHELNVVIKNVNGNHSFPFRKKFVIE